VSGARVVVGLAVVGLAAFALVAYARTAVDAQAPEDEADGSILGGLNWGGLVGYTDPIASAVYDLETEVQSMTPIYSGISPDANARAFLQTIQRCEGTPDAGGYACLYGSTPGRPLTFSSFADHPYLTGEWPGVHLSDVQCAGAGLSSGCITTAAGAYQFTRGTWKGLRDRLSLPDFSPASQDAAALQKLRDIGAYAALARGDLAGAVAKARSTWASLPGAGYAGQGTRSMEQVAAWYTGNGGALA
jgi:lysozyme